MNDAFSQIADLFQIVSPELTETGELPATKRKGETAEESDALGAKCLNDGDYATAIEHFKRAVAQRDESDLASRINLAGAYDYADEMPQAFRQYEKALRVRRDCPEPWVGLADVYKRYGRFRDAIQKLEEAVRLEPENAYYRMKLAENLRDMGAPKQAHSAALGAVAAAPEVAFYHYWTGDLCIQMKRDEEALDWLRAAIELSPGDDYLYLRAAVPFWRVGRKVEALKAVRLASDLNPANNLYHGLLEALMLEMNMEAEAALESERADKMDRYDHDALARVLAEMGIGEE